MTISLHLRGGISSQRFIDVLLKRGLPDMSQ